MSFPPIAAPTEPLRTTRKWHITLMKEMVMRLLIAALALSISGTAFAQTAPAPAPAPKADCCEKMKAEGKKCCCDDMGKDHDNHDMKDMKH